MIEKKSYHNENLKEKFLEVTITLIKKDGYQHVSTRKIAKELDVSSTAIYRHYHNLEDLFSTVIINSSTVLAKKLSHHVDEKGSYESCLEEMGINFVQFSVENPNIFDLLFLSPYSPKRIFEVETVVNEFPTISLFLKLV